MSNSKAKKGWSMGNSERKFFTSVAAKKSKLTPGAGTYDIDTKGVKNMVHKKYSPGRRR